MWRFLLKLCARHCSIDHIFPYLGHIELKIWTHVRFQSTIPENWFFLQSGDFWAKNVQFKIQNWAKSGWSYSKYGRDIEAYSLRTKWNKPLLTNYTVHTLQRDQNKGNKCEKNESCIFVIGNIDFFNLYVLKTCFFTKSYMHINIYFSYILDNKIYYNRNRKMSIIVGKKCEIDAQIDIKLLRYWLISHVLPKIETLWVSYFFLLRNIAVVEYKNACLFSLFHKMGTFWACRLSIPFPNNSDKENLTYNKWVSIEFELKCNRWE